jgi:hypothetical protein
VWKTETAAGNLVLCALCVLAPLAAAAQNPAPPAGRGAAPAAPFQPGTVPPTATATGTARIRGRVINGATGAPLRGAEVALSGDLFRQADTDDDGRFELADLPAGRYTLRATKPGYATPGSSLITADPGRSFVLSDGQTLTRDATLFGGGVITGRISDEFGEPVTGLEVRVERYTWGPAGRQLATASQGGGFIPFSLRTNDLGEFRVFGLAQGDYIISTRSQQFGAPLTRGAAGMRDRSEGYPPTFYPGTTRQSEAQAVRVRAGQETGASFAVAGGRMLRVSGRAMNSRGQPAVGLNVYLGIQTSNSSGQLDGGPIGPDGSFSIGNVAAGDYVLRVRQAGQTGPGTEVASLPITVATEDLSDLQIVTRPGTNIAGRVEWDGTAPRPTNPLRINTRAAAPAGNGPIGESTITYSDFQNGTVREDDTFEIGGIVGTVLFGASPAQPWTLKSVSLNGKEITDVGMEAASLGGDSRVVVVMTDRSTTVSGIARGGAAQPVTEYAVVVLPQQPVAGAAGTRYTRFLRPDDTGTFTIRGLPIGDYVAAAAESLEPGSEWDPAVQKRARSSGQRFSLADGQTLTLTLDVLR